MEVVEGDELEPLTVVAIDCTVAVGGDNSEGLAGERIGADESL